MGRRRAQVVLLLLLAAPGFAQAQNGTVTTNSTASAGAEKTVPGQGTLDQFESDLFGANRRLDLRAPGTETPQIRRPILVKPDERTQQKMDAQKNWMFSGMHDLNSTPTLEQLLGMPEVGPDGLAKPKMTAMEQYYDDLGQRNASATNSLGDAMTMLWAVKRLAGTNAVNPIVFAFPGGDQTLLKNLMTMPNLDHPDKDAGGGGNDSPEVSDSLAAARAAAASDRAQKHYADAFKQLLGLEPSAPAGAPSTFGNSSSSPFSVTPPAVYNPTPAPAAVSLTPNSLNAVSSPFNPGGAAAGGYHPFDAVTGAPTVNAAGIPFSNPQTQLPQPTSPVSAIPIDPFTAYFPKRTH